MIEKFEGLRLSAYLDSVGIPTIGVGHTSGVHLGETITAEDADNILAIDLHHAEQAIYNYVTVELDQNQFDALASLIFNIGGGAFSKSTLLKLLNGGDEVGAANQFLAWNKAGGKVLDGLTRRRAAERELFLAPRETK